MERSPHLEDSQETAPTDSEAVLTPAQVAEQLQMILTSRASHEAHRILDKDAVPDTNDGTLLIMARDMFESGELDRDEVLGTEEAKELYDRTLQSHIDAIEERHDLDVPVLEPSSMSHLDNRLNPGS
ncbi:MAG TPA: hypothetical protein VMR34_01935 [Candidatus Saccharimonadales bacterium]|nr:hypothetical protein [Candidatus Saccharimonadales bacterium]